MRKQKKNNCFYIGLMSGTSMDAIDAVLTEFKKNILTLSKHKFNINLLGETDAQLGHLFSKAVLKLLKNSKIKRDQITAIGSHGQTIFHSPNATHPFTLQLADPNIIAAKTGITTISDFRRRDIAEGGQGAPLVPAFHRYLFNIQNAQNRDQFVLNIGCIANLTYLSKNKNKKIIGFDTGPGNTLLDQWCFLNTQKTMDKNGCWAKSGKINNTLLKLLLSDQYFKKKYPKSTGPEYFNLSWLKRKIKNLKINAKDIQATLTELTAKSIAGQLKQLCSNENKKLLWVCGGGVKNHYLMSRLKIHCPNFLVQSTQKINIEPQWMEAAAFAWLAKQTIEKKSGNVTHVTGAKRPAILGAIYTA